MAKILEYFANFQWKKNWKWVALCIAILVILIVAIIVLIVYSLRFKCSTATEAPHEVYQIRALQLHNAHRNNHQAGPLRLNSSLNIKAVDCAHYYVTKVGGVDHSCPCKKGAGESLFMVRARMDSDHAASQAIEVWYNENKDYKYESPKFSRSTLHFTAMVWKSARELGVGHHSGEGITVVVALYSPHPNVEHHFPDNVHPPLDDPEEKLIIGHDDSL